MPQGKGTYGSQVGRPPKKKKYQTGGSVDPFSAKNPEGIVAEKAMEAIEGMNAQESMQDAIPTANAMDRSQIFREGGKIEDWKEEGYEFHTKKIKSEILGKKGTHFDYDVTDLVKLRGRRQKEIDKFKKGKK